jgi:hypothetical protein
MNKIMKIKLSINPLTVIAALLCAAAVEVRADIVSFGFSGVISTFYNPSNALPADISVGMPFNGVLTYDTSVVYLGGDLDPYPEVGDYYFNTNGGFWLQVSVAGHTFASVQPGPGDQFAVIAIHHYIGEDATFSADASAQTIRMDGAPLPGTYNSTGFSFDLFDNSGMGCTNDALPKVPPQLAAFPSAHRFELDASYGSPRTFDVIGTITNISASFAPTLAIRRDAGGNVVLAWPLAAHGFTPETTTNLVGANWESVPAPVIDVSTEHTVTVPPAGPQRFYRLKAP